MKEMKNGNAWALIPLLLFVLLFLGVGIISGDFTTMPLNVANNYCYCCLTDESQGNFCKK